MKKFQKLISLIDERIKIQDIIGFLVGFGLGFLFIGIISVILMHLM